MLAKVWLGSVLSVPTLDARAQFQERDLGHLFAGTGKPFNLSLDWGIAFAWQRTEEGDET